MLDELWAETVELEEGHGRGERGVKGVGVNSDLENTHDTSSANIWRDISERFFEWAFNIFQDRFHSQATERAKGKTTDHGIFIFTA
jgi:hypothetical protein